MAVEAVEANFVLLTKFGAGRQESTSKTAAKPYA